MKIGLIAGNFDVIHPGYTHMFNYMNERVDHVWVLLDNNDYKSRPEKNKPILSAGEREQTVRLLKPVDHVIHYKNEEDLLLILKGLPIIYPQFQFIRFLGDDYKGRDPKTFTNHSAEEIHFIPREHNWSTTKFKKKIFNSLKDHQKTI